MINLLRKIKGKSTDHSNLEIACINSSQAIEKEIEQDIRRQQDLPCSWICRITNMQKAILPEAIDRFNATPIKTLTHLLHKFKTQS